MTRHDEAMLKDRSASASEDMNLHKLISFEEISE